MPNTQEKTQIKPIENLIQENINESLSKIINPWKMLGVEFSSAEIKKIPENLVAPIQKLCGMEDLLKPEYHVVRRNLYPDSRDFYFIALPVDEKNKVIKGIEIAIGAQGNKKNQYDGYANFKLKEGQFPIGISSILSLSRIAGPPEDRTSGKTYSWNLFDEYYADAKQVTSKLKNDLLVAQSIREYAERHKKT